MNLRGVLSRGAVVALLFSVVSLGAGATPARALDPLTDTTTVVTVSPSPSLAGQYIEVCATVSAGRGTPAGDVTFTVPSRLSETLALDTGKICFGTTSLLDPGTVTAVYGGSADFAGSEGSAPLIINKAPTTTVVGNLQPTVTGQLTMLCATVTVDPPGAGTVTGSVRFSGPDGFIGAAAPTSSGACLATRAATSGTLIASFTGNPWLLPSGGTGTMVVGRAETATAVTVSPDPSMDGETVEACATVTVLPDGQGAPTGTVSFVGPGGPTGTADLAGGVGCLTTQTLATGNHTVTYGGDPDFEGSMTTASVTVLPGDTTTTVSAPGTSVTGQAVTVCATVTAVAPGTGTPAGTVVFTGPGGFSRSELLDDNGQACVISTTLSTGMITAIYGGDAGYVASTGTAAVTVLPAGTELTMSIDPNPSEDSQPVTVCASVAATAPGSGTPGGTVAFAGAGLDESAALVDGEACVTTSSAVSGTVVVTYGGSERYGGDSASQFLLVGLVPTVTELIATRSGPSVELCASAAIDPDFAGASANADEPGPTFTFTGLRGLDETVALTEQPVCITVRDGDGGTAKATFSGGWIYDSSSGTATVAPLRPSAPRDVTAVGGVSSIEVSWEPPAIGATVTGYTVTAEPGPAVCTTTGATTCLLGGTAGTTYTATVVAHWAGGDSPPSARSNQAVAKTPVAPPAPPPSDLTLTTTDGDLSVADPGQRIVFLGSGFLPYATAVVTIYSAPRILGAVTTDVDGDFRLAVTLPTRLAAGVHTVVALGTAPDGTARAMTIEVTVAAALPVTGPAITLLLMAGAGLAVTGTGLVLVGRIRPRSRRFRAAIG